MNWMAENGWEYQGHAIYGEYFIFPPIPGLGIAVWGAESWLPCVLDDAE